MAQAAIKLLRGYISSLFSADEDAAGVPSLHQVKRILSDFVEKKQQ